MSELLPSVQADDIRAGLVNYLTTTFALSDPEARGALERFLVDPEQGIFKGPYVRLRVPFRPADESWREALEWQPDFTPHGHQAEAFVRLSSANLGTQSDGTIKTRPLPTLVTTGTGSGKTEAFLYPILDHVLRAKRAGEGGIKALILYPMNALANDQARRLADLIMGYPELAGVRAALYTGQSGPERSVVSDDGLITDRGAIRSQPPDILLTNYKMLDQLLLRTADQNLWHQSATSLRYLVLDEFHTYDGAQGTDVAMLLRRLGLALKRNWPTEHPDIDDEVRSRPLGLATPIATSATLGDKGDPIEMLSFAETVFGDEFDEHAVVTETRLGVDAWAEGAADRLAAHGIEHRTVDNALVGAVNDAIDALGVAEGRDADAITRAVLGTLYRSTSGSEHPEPHEIEFDIDDHELLLDLVKAHPFTHALIAATADAQSLDELAERVLPAGLGSLETFEARRDARRSFLTAIIATLSHVRFRVGSAALSVDLHLWMRALTRLDRVAGPSVSFRWSDDGLVEQAVNDDAFSEAGRPEFPAIYCRHCGRSGWGVELAPIGHDLATDDTNIRRNHANKENSRFRALIFAPQEADRSLVQAAAEGEPVDGLHWLSVNERVVTAAPPADDDAELANGNVLPVLALTGDDAGDDSNDDVCPSCQRTDGIRFVGSAIATMLSVAVTTIFGDRHLDSGEKKALVFTDSVQDAAHRAGFVQSRSHVFTLRNAIREAVGDRRIGLDTLVEELVSDAGDDRFKRYRLLAPDIAERPEFAEFWRVARARSIPTAVLRRVRRRLLLDVELEFGLQSRVGRTLELTGSLAAQVDAGEPSRLEGIGRAALKGFWRQESLDENAPSDVPSERVVMWVRGVLERMRDRGAIEHEWFAKYIQNDGKRWFVWGGRPRGAGMPAFPEGRDAPGYPRVGGQAPSGKDSQRTHLDVATSSQSWFASWAKRVLHVTPGDGAKLTRAVLAELDRVGVIAAVPIASTGAVAYQLSPAIVTVEPVERDDLSSKRHLLVCDVCQSPVPGTVQVVDQLDGAPCFAARCPGTMRRVNGGADYYRELYDEGDMRRVVAREHTSLLEDKVRLQYENGFKASIEQPDAPNVLVATPTLEMGIDIGDLSTVMLAGLPRSVASYLQRIGRAGRLTGNSLSLAFVNGRGDQLPKLGDPLSVINGRVRPPATYLNAEEILQRQYLAYLIDRRAAELEIPPRRATDVLKTTDERSFLGDLLDDAEAEHATRVTEFLGTFSLLSGWASDALRSWAAPGTTPRSSGLAATIIRATQKWNKELDLLRFRRQAVDEALPELKKAAEHPAAKDDAKLEYNSARASYKMLGGLIARQRDEPWVAALERFGVLPNYTLLDDNVELDVALSWIDPDSGEFQNDAVSYQRGASVALSELAPGAVFYAQGLEVTVDAVDLGVEGEAVRPWVFCPACGFGYDVGTISAPHSSCPRCGSKAITDTAQQVRVLELEHVSAEVRRDEASINDRRDERQRERFTIQVVADIDPDAVARQWYVPDTGFGIKYLRSIDIRWLNLGRAVAFGQARQIAGDERLAPLFRVCEVCGKLDSAANANSRREHRAWCRNRTSQQEHVTTLALSRTLSTQGVVLRLPAALTLGDSLAVPSLTAALLLGLRETIGGDPDHLRVERIVEPVLSDGGDNIPALLIHDAVPGGTGYLAEMADPERIRDVLEAAWSVVRDCPCRLEGRAACHRCVLPYAPGGAIELVSRASAEHSLRLLLGIDENGGAHPWEVTETAGPAPEPPLESFFRKVFIDRARALGATVKEIPSEWGNKVQVNLPNSRRVWMLQPQVKIGGTVPDFMLQQFGGGARSIAIYTDGKAYHASLAHNRIADDAQKRRSLRDLGYLVMGVTWADVERADSGMAEPEVDWFSPGHAELFAQGYGIPLGSLQHIVANPITQLMDWMQDPDAAASRWATMAAALPTLIMKPKGTFVDIGESSLADATAETLRGHGPAMSNQPLTWQVRNGGVLLASRLLDGEGATEVILMLDDRNVALQHDGFADSWRLWLQWSNLLGARTEPTHAQILALSEVTEATAPVGPADFQSSAPLSGEWEELLEYASAQEATLLRQLSEVTDMVIPEVGIEVGDGIPVGIAWPQQSLAVATAGVDDARSELEAAGWTVVEPNFGAILAALNVGNQE